MCCWLKLAGIVAFKAEKLRDAQEVCVCDLYLSCVHLRVCPPACVSTCFYRLVPPHFLFLHERTKHLHIEAIHQLQPIICWLYLPASWLGMREQANTRVTISVPPPQPAPAFQTY